MIKYQLISRKNPITKEYLYCAQAEAVTPVKLEEVAESISNSCTVGMADIKAVLYALQEEIVRCLRNGQSVRLGDLGSFHARLSAKGVATVADFEKNPSEYLKSVLVRFTPSSKMRWDLSLKNPKVSLAYQV
jgi:predicted histone-like DNA-binding protein